MEANKSEISSVDLTSGTSVHLVEPHWNPMVEAQAVDRVHRIGQYRNVTITRYIVKDSIEKVRYLCSVYTASTKNFSGWMFADMFFCQVRARDSTSQAEIGSRFAR